MPEASYITVQDLRDEGITVSMLSDAAAAAKILEWSSFVDQITGTWFNPRSRTLHLDTKAGPSMMVGYPIIQIDNIYFVSGRGSDYDTEEVEVSDVRVYNRHLTQGLTRPDDRLNPRIEWPVWPYGGSPYSGRYDRQWLASDFYDGRLTVRLDGVFGYTELQTGDTIGETSTGSQVPVSQGHTPRLIEKAVKLLVLRDMPQLVDTGFRQDLRSRWAITSEKTADQSYTMASPGTIGQAGGWTGDPEVDMFLSMFVTSRGGFAAEVV